MEKLSTVVYLRYMYCNWTCYCSTVVWGCFSGLQLRDNVTTENLRKKIIKQKVKIQAEGNACFFVNQSGSHVITCNLAAAKLITFPIEKKKEKLLGTKVFPLQHNWLVSSVGRVACS